MKGMDGWFSRVPRWVWLTVVAALLLLVGLNMWGLEDPPGGSGPWVAVTLAGAGVGVAAAVSLGTGRRR